MRRNATGIKTMRIAAMAKERQTPCWLGVGAGAAAAAGVVSLTASSYCSALRSCLPWTLSRDVHNKINNKIVQKGEKVAVTLRIWEEQAHRCEAEAVRAIYGGNPKTFRPDWLLGRLTECRNAWVTVSPPPTSPPPPVKSAKRKRKLQQPQQQHVNAAATLQCNRV